MQCYPEETEDLMRQYYESLNERDRRRYAGMEALKFRAPDIRLESGIKCIFILMSCVLSRKSSSYFKMQSKKRMIFDLLAFAPII